MTPYLSPFTIFLIVIGATTLSCGAVYFLIRFDAWLAGRKW